VEELQIIGLALGVVTTIAILTIAFNVVAIRRILEGRNERSDATNRSSERGSAMGS
jgi:hypothetical protein